jgi:hypothetical protein
MAAVEEDYKTSFYLAGKARHADIEYGKSFAEFRVV